MAKMKNAQLVTDALLAHHALVAQYEAEIALSRQVEVFANDTPDKRKARLARAARDPIYFGQTYLPHYFDLPSAACHREWVRLARQSVAEQQPMELRASRDLGKSVVMTFAFQLWSALHNTRFFGLTVSATNRQAEGLVSPIRAEIVGNARLKADFGELQGDQWTADLFRLTTGAAFMARGRAQAVRGVREGAWRPTLIILDDYDTDARAQNPDLVRQDYDLIKKSFYPALDRTGTLMIVGNLFSRQSVLALCAGDDEFLHRQDDIIRDGLWNETTRRYTAGKSGWPKKFSLAAISQKRRFVGDRIFNAEYLNAPESGGNTFQREWLLRHDEATVDATGALTVFGIDPSVTDSRTADFKALIVWSWIERLKKRLVRTCWIRRDSMGALMAMAYRLAPIYNPALVVVEDGLQEWIEGERMRQCPHGHPLLPVFYQSHEGVPKDARVARLAPLFESGQISIAQAGGDTSRLMDQLIHYPSDAVGRDGPDAMEMAERGLKRIMGFGTGQIPLTQMPQPGPFASKPPWEPRDWGTQRGAF